MRAESISCTTDLAGPAGVLHRVVDTTYEYLTDQRSPAGSVPTKLVATPRAEHRQQRRAAITCTRQVCVDSPLVLGPTPASPGSRLAGPPQVIAASAAVQLERPITDSFEATDRATVADDEDLQMSRVRLKHQRKVHVCRSLSAPSCVLAHIFCREQAHMLIDYACHRHPRLPFPFGIRLASTYKLGKSSAGVALTRRPCWASFWVAARGRGCTL